MAGEQDQIKLNPQGGRAASLIGIIELKGLPERVVSQLHDAFKKAMEGATLKKTAEKLSILVVYRGPGDQQ